MYPMMRATLLAFLLLVSGVFATPKFILLPYNQDNVVLQQGWIYMDGGTHRGIDWHRNWEPFNVIACHDGQATYFGGCSDNDPSCNGGLGNYVRIRKNIDGTNYYTLYCHLQSSPLTPNTPTNVPSGYFIGVTGITGAANDVNHLHFEYHEGSVGNKKDPYDIYANRDSYPPSGGNCGANYAWTTCPPGTEYTYEVALPINEGGAQFVDGIQTNEATMIPGGSWAHFTVRYKNKCNFTWSNNPSDPNYVHLMSCGDEGDDVQASFLNNPWNSSLGWTQSPAHVTSFNEGTVAPGVIATFEFDGYIPSGANPTTTPVPVYFSLHHATHGFISDGWGGLSFQVTVDDDSEPGGGSGNKADICTLYDYPSTSSRLHMYLSNGSTFDYTGKYGWWMSTSYNSDDVLATVSADVNGDAYDDVVTMYDYPSSRRLHVFLSTGSSFSWQGSTGWYLSSSSYDATKVVGMVAGYFNNDDYEDVAVIYAHADNRIELQVFISNGSSAFSKQSWWDSDGIMSYYRDNIHGFTVGDYNNDGEDDICIVYHMGYRSTGEGYLTRLHVFKSTGSGFTLNPTVGWWSSPDNYEAACVHGAVSGDFDNDGKDDVALVYYMGYRSGGAGYLTRLHFFKSTGSSFNYYQIWWNPPENYEADKIVHVAADDFTGDGVPDVCMMYDSTGVRLHVFRSTTSSFAMSQGYGGWWMNTGYNPSKEVAMVAGYFNESGAAPKVAQGEAPLPTVFSLNQNYPNPFNPMTVISYSLPEASDVKLDVFNILGQRVATLINQKQEAGEHTITWDASSVASGVYFYRIQTAEAVETKKMLLLK